MLLINWQASPDYLKTLGQSAEDCEYWPVCQRSLLIVLIHFFKLYDKYYAMEVRGRSNSRELDGLTPITTPQRGRADGRGAAAFGRSNSAPSLRSPTSSTSDAPGPSMPKPGFAPTRPIQSAPASPVRLDATSRSWLPHMGTASASVVVAPSASSPREQVGVTPTKEPVLVARAMNKFSSGLRMLLNAFKTQNHANEAARSAAPVKTPVAQRTVASDLYHVESVPHEDDLTGSLALLFAAERHALIDPETKTVRIPDGFIKSTMRERREVLYGTEKKSLAITNQVSKCLTKCFDGSAATKLMNETLEELYDKFSKTPDTLKNLSMDRAEIPHDAENKDFLIKAAQYNQTALKPVNKLVQDLFGKDNSYDESKLPRGMLDALVEMDRETVKLCVQDRAVTAEDIHKVRMNVLVGFVVIRTLGPMMTGQVNPHTEGTAEHASFQKIKMTFSSYATICMNQAVKPFLNNLIMKSNDGLSPDLKEQLLNR